MVSATDDNGNLKYVPLPKTADGLIDKEKLKAEYFAAAGVTLQDFAKEKGYSATYLCEKIPFKLWREEKLKYLVELQDESTRHRVVNARAALINTQFKVVEKVPEALMGTLRLYEYVVAKHTQDAADDERDKSSGRAKEKGWAPKFKLKPSDLAALSITGSNLQTSLYKAALMGENRPSVANALLEVATMLQDSISAAQNSQQTVQANGGREVAVKGLGKIDPERAAQIFLQYLNRPGQAGSFGPEQPAPISPVSAPPEPNVIEDVEFQDEDDG
jgi:hypothetical protein